MHHAQLLRTLARARARPGRRKIDTADSRRNELNT